MKNCIKAVTLFEDKKDLLATIAASIGNKKKNLVSKQTEVLHAYDSYTTNISNPSLNPITLSKAVHKSYYSLFDGTGPTIKRIKSYIRGDAEAVCLFCALNEYDSLDHYLPRAHFPEFSICSRNLVPICTICNRDWKKQKWGGGSTRPFLHPNVDFLNSEEYLTCSVKVVNGGLNIQFSIDKTSIADAVLADVLENHFKNLDMAVRLRKRTQKDDVDDLIRCMQGKASVAEKEAALLEYIAPLLVNKRDLRLQAFYKAVHATRSQIAATAWVPV